MSELLLDRGGRRRSPATMPGFHAGHAPANKGVRYPADPPKVEEIIAVMRACGDAAHGRRRRGLIVIMWSRVAHPGGSGSDRGRSRSTPRRSAGPPRQRRASSRGRHRRMAAAGAEPRRTAGAAGVRRRFAQHQLRFAHAVEMAREGVPSIVIQRQLGHSNLGITSSTSRASTAARSSRPSPPDARR
jgi:hypothetical protein